MVNIFYLDHNPRKCAKYYCNKHVVKILVEILQILSQVHHFFGEKVPPYKKCRSIGKNLGPFLWAKESIGNYIYCYKLAKALISEYKFRFNNKTHKCEKIINWFSINIPRQIKKVKKTKFILTENVRVYSNYFKDIVEASRFIYVDFKCKNDRWGRRGRPIWFNKYSKESSKRKKS